MLVRESVALEGAPHRRSATGLLGTVPPGEGVRAAILERSDNRGNQRTDRPPLDLVHHPSFASQQSSPTGPVGLVTVPVEVPGYRQERETGALRSYRARELAHAPAFAATWRTLVVALYDSASSTSNWAAHRSIGSSLAGATSLLERRASKPQPVVVGLLLIGGQGSRTRHGGTPETSAGSFDSWWVA
jgi:hypothetical protein